MFNTDNAPAIFAHIDIPAPTLTIEEEQRQSVRQAIALFRELAPQFLEKAEKIVQEGTTIAEIFSATNDATRLSSALTAICRPMWALEHAEFQRNTEALNGQ